MIVWLYFSLNEVMVGEVSEGLCMHAKYIKKWILDRTKTTEIHKPLSISYNFFL